MTDEALVAKVNDHLEKVHPEMAGKYSEEQILSVATES